MTKSINSNNVNKSSLNLTINNYTSTTPTANINQINSQNNSILNNSTRNCGNNMFMSNKYNEYKKKISSIICKENNTFTNQTGRSPIFRQKVEKNDCILEKNLNKFQTNAHSLNSTNGFNLNRLVSSRTPKKFINIAVKKSELEIKIGC